MTKIEMKICEFLEKYIAFIGFAAVTLLSLFLRIAMLDKVTSDYSFFMSKWIAQLNEYNGLAGLGESIGEYNVPYMTFLAIIGKTPANDLHEIKILSIIFDYIGACAAVMILSMIGEKKFFSVSNLVAYAVILFNPVFFLNSAYWAQCDFIYTALCLLSLYYILKGKNNFGMIFFALALTVKLQAIFFLPTLVIYYFVTGKVKIANFLWIPPIFVLAALPAIIAGRDAFETLSIYFAQTSIYSSLTMSCPNIFVFITGEYEIFSKVGILLTLTALGVGLCYLMKCKKLTSEKMLLLATWCSFVCVFFLPAMHERYPFMACAFSLIWAFINKKDAWVAIGINLVCFLSYTPYLFKNTVIDMKYLAIANFVFLVYISYKLFLSKDNNEDVNDKKVKIN